MIIQPIKIVKQEIRRINSKIPLDLTTHFTAAQIANTYINYLMSKDQYIEDKYATEIVQTSVLLGAKMSERDIHIPTVSDISISGGMLL